ncbi:P-loop NTPase fold protein [Mucilaginibacter sp. L3T2-6]|uniref:P-loop NTPase fold protein n=1 Tax=Mucilaginibacter sp. L3T2-6 TaxID=3062491 RepID=UPI002674B763|nr:P-loop NTPase fold protein [Mucilaginibacter sp. L3T2-6]MDO3641999.1 P-loop NTPase fold protein [Mucilaginibacter sp. L3T2-6]MDV6214323.1 P-loop NTPase fold protein [Mucilaginibacter sp. L3T2-6]
MEHIDISDQLELFKEHIENSKNLRIIVSGPFGSGKTYFLDKFFDNNTAYNLIKLYPVNYSVASNEDIFQLIKFDVLFELLCNPGVEFNKEYFDNFLTGQLFVQQNAFDIIKPLIEKIPKIGKATATAADTLIKFSEKYEEFHKDVQVDDFKKATDFIKKIKNAIASVEEDSITELIRASIQSLSVENKETVLLIDDLDRIDPEHIFRILNVFSSHFDSHTNGNKFFFDKIILVCDVENIRTIFHNRYGSNIDFSGYIDKFYSRNIFRFNNNLNIEQFIERSIQLIDGNDVFNHALGIREGSSQYFFLVCILKDLLARHYINLRKLRGLEKMPFAKVNSISASLPGGNRLSRTEHPIIVIIELLIDILGSKKVLLEAVNDLQNFNASVESQSKIFAGLMLPLLGIKENRLDSGQICSFFNPEKNKPFKYRLWETRDKVFYADFNLQDHGYEPSLDFDTHQINVLNLFLQLIQQLDKYKVI